MRIAARQDTYSPEGKQKLLYMAGCMRYHLMQEDANGFNDYVNNILASSPDAAGLLLDDLFEELGIEDRYELDVKLQEA
jgi:hypothetical protein